MFEELCFASDLQILKSLELNQLLTKRRGDISFVAEGPLQQFQIDLIYMPKSWFNNGYKYIQDVGKDDKLYTHKGNFQKINDFQTKIYNGEMINNRDI